MTGAGRPLAVLFTDLDGTFLDHHTYRPGPALPALHRLRRAGVLVLPATAKTLAEVRHLAAELGGTDGAIVENGAAVALPRGFPGYPAQPGHPAQLGRPAQPNYPARELPREMAVLGTPYPEIRRVLVQAAAATGAAVRGYGDLTADQVAVVTGLSPAAAVRARARQWSESFQVTAGDPAALAAALGRRGLRVVRGARFLTAQGRHDKGAAARLVLDRLRRTGRPVRSWAVGDAANDAELLAAVDHPMLVRAHGGAWAELDLPGVQLSGLVRLDGVGPDGWVLAAERIAATTR